MEIKINSLNEIEKGAEKFISDNPKKRIFAFYGKMGAGKTTFIKAICKNLGVNDMINSPSFAIVNDYLAADGKTIHHFDFYRVKNIEEVYDIGYEDYFYGESICFIEWPELVESLLPQETLRINIRETADGARVVSY